MNDSYLLRTLTGAEEFKGVAALLGAAFGEDFPPEEAERDELVIEPARIHVIEDAGVLVANAGAYTRELTAPGTPVPAAHVTLVGVRPTYRRQGLLTRLMHHQLRELRDANREPVAALWASEGRIYQRYGYGLAAYKRTIELDRREVRLLAPPTGAARLRDAAPGDVVAELAQVYERVRADRPGWSSRDSRWWQWRLADPPSRRGGCTARRALLYESADGPAGYALWRTRMSWDHTGPRGDTLVNEIVTATPQAYVELWRFLLSVDLTRFVRYSYAAVDEPLTYLVDEPRALGGRVGDALWVRLVDVPSALAARRYASPIDVVVDVSDDLLPENTGRWRLVGDESGARCETTTGPADLACGVADLGAAYLGGTGLGALAAAGRVRELRRGAVAAAATAFGWHRAPSTLDTF